MTVPDSNCQNRRLSTVQYDIHFVRYCHFLMKYISEYFNYIYFQIGTILLENGDKLRQSTDWKHLERKTNHISQEGQTPCLLPTTRRSPFFSMDVLVVVAKAREVRLQDNDRGSILKCAVFFYVL